MQNEQNKILEPKWVSELMEMEVTNNQIKDLQEKWKNKCETELANLALDKVRTLPLFANVKSFLKKVFSRQYVTTKKHKIDEGKFSLNNQTWVEFAFDADIRERFLNFIAHHNLSANVGFETLKKYFGDGLRSIKMVDNNYYLEWSGFIGRETKKLDKQNIDSLFDVLWSGILESAKIVAQNGEKKSYNNLSDEDILKIINAYQEIFGSQKLYKEYKEKILWPKFVSELSNDTQEFCSKNNFGKFGDLEKYKPFTKSFWDIYSTESKDWLVGELDNYFKLELAQRGDSILKKILTDKLVNIECLTATKIEGTYTNLGEFIKKYFDKYFGDYSEYIYCTLGEFFGDNEEFFNKVCKEDATRILKCYEKYLLNDLGSDFYNRLKQGTEQVKDNAEKNNLNNKFNLQEQKNPEKQETIKVNEQKQDLVDKNIWEKTFWISLCITVLVSIGVSVVCINFDVSSLWLIAPGVGFMFTGFSSYKMSIFKSKKNYGDILLLKTNDPEDVDVTYLKKNESEMKKVEQNKNPKLAKIIKNKNTQKE